ncbi:MAG: T9SS type A sorting domain-containing protein [Bacteroidetes bacterium]|nr:T9SS type A sorting domain-containing protein [Bacteroidota bacterium]
MKKIYKSSKREILIFLFLVFSLSSFGQILPEWVDTIGVPPPNYALQVDMKVDPFGNTYVGSLRADTSGNQYLELVKYNAAGTRLFVVDTTLSYTYSLSIEIDDSMNVYAAINDGSPNSILILKYNTIGNLVWSSTNASLSHYSFSGGYIKTIIDHNNNIYVSGQGDSIPVNSNHDIITIKFNSSGVYQWSARYDHDWNDGGFVYLGLDSMLNVYVTGRSWDPITSWDIALIKYNSSGVQQWVQRFDITGIDYETPSSFAVSPGGNCYVGGMYSVNGGGGADYLVIKYDSSGNFKWSSVYNVTAGEDWLKSLKIDSSENVYVTGTSALNSGPDRNYFTMKYDSSGNILWTRSYDSSNGLGFGEDAKALCLDYLNNVYVTGFSFDGKKYIFTIKYDTNGDTLWVASYRYNSMSSSEAYNCSCDSYNNVYLSGVHNDYNGSVSLITLKYGSTVNVEEIISSNDYVLYPNPTSSILNLFLKNEVNIIVTNMLGEIVLQKNAEGKVELDVTSLSAGIYFIKAGNEVRKFVKEIKKV